MRIFLALLLLLLSACASHEVIEDEGLSKKKELTIWELIRFKEAGEEKIDYEDKWFTYKVEFEYVVKHKFDNVTKIDAQCPIYSATYTVFDKKTKALVKEEKYAQNPCDTCHRR